jgi:ADP-ribosylglycohydrolase
MNPPAAVRISRERLGLAANPPAETHRVASFPAPAIIAASILSAKECAMPTVPIFVDKNLLNCELVQLRDEGHNTRRLEPAFETLRRRKLDTAPNQAAAIELFENAQKLPMAKDYPFNEPSDLEGIRKVRPRGKKIKLSMSKKKLRDRVHGAWLGRCAGCLLGKPIEGIRSSQLWPYLSATNQYPLAAYISPKATPAVFEQCGIDESRQKRLHIPFRSGGMPEDDDTNYTVTGLAIVKQHGPDFTPAHVADFWLRNIPFHHVCTAEKIAYRNLCAGIQPPESATFCNAYREWIGAQIRADFFGYVAVGDPKRAAELAWRDASISHTKNGIYGEMWVAAMLAAAPALDDPADVLRAGLAQIPAKSRLSNSVEHVIRRWKDGVPAAEMEAEIHTRWDETNRHHWVHTLSNAEIVAMGMLWGELDFGRSISIAVQACFDTDCNGATVGSVIGMMLGAKKLPGEWIDPLNDTLETGVAGYHRVSISALADETMELRKQVMG